MQIKAIFAALTTALTPLPVLAGDAVVPASGDDLRAAIDGAARGSVRMIYLAAAPEAASAPQVSAPDITGARPPSRPVIVLAGICAGEDGASGRIRQAFGMTPAWLLEPAGESCDPAALRAAFDKAAAAPERERLALLLQDGLRLSDAERPAAGEPASGPAPLAASGGGLVISALPVGASLGGGASLVIGASPPDSLPAAETGAEAPPEAAPDETPAIAVAAHRPGLPEPAVVVGELAALLGAGNRGPIGTPREVRDRIRSIDPAFFATLLDMGSFDPEGGQYAAAIQTELAGMNCYTGSIDGDWGSGSLAALGRYFSQLGAAQAAQAPGPELYREIALHRSVICPAPAPAPVVARPRESTPAATRGGATRSTGGGTQPRGNVNIGQNVNVGQNVQISGTPPQPGGPPRIDSSLIGLGAGVIK